MLHKRQLAYQAEAMVNYDPVDKTVLANEQVSVQYPPSLIYRADLIRSIRMVALGDLAQWWSSSSSSNGSSV